VVGEGQSDACGAGQQARLVARGAFAGVLESDGCLGSNAAWTAAAARSAVTFWLAAAH
jgi:hypothetical protein